MHGRFRLLRHRHMHTQTHSWRCVTAQGGLTKHKALGILREQVSGHCWDSICGGHRFRGGHSCNSSRRLDRHASSTGGHVAWRWSADVQAQSSTCLGMRCGHCQSCILTVEVIV